MKPSALYPWPKISWIGCLSGTVFMLLYVFGDAVWYGPMLISLVVATYSMGRRDQTAAILDDPIKARVRELRKKES